MSTWIMLPDMIDSLKKDERYRSVQDLKILFYNLRRLTCLLSLEDLALFELCRCVYYKCYQTGSLLYCRDTDATCWFIIISGSVYVDGVLFQPPNCVGKRTGGKVIYENDCIALELTEVIVVDYPDCSNNEKRQGSLDNAGPMPCEPQMAGDVDQEYIEVFDLSINEQSIESDSEDISYDLSNVEDVEDNIYQCLAKPPKNRTDEDIDVIVDSINYIQAFSKMTAAVRRALCSVMEYRLVEKSETVLLRHGDIVDKWTVILNGLVELINTDGSPLELHDSFGTMPGMDKFIQQGSIRTKVDKCQFIEISHNDISNILNQGVANTESIEEHGQTVLVKEKRSGVQNSKTGSVVIRGSSEQLVSHLIDYDSSVDATFVEDFLLTYRTFLTSPHKITQQLMDWFHDVNLRSKVIRIVLLWANNHFRDFEIDQVLFEFLEKFLSAVSREGLEGPYLLLCLTCSSKSHNRHVVISRSSSVESWPFELLFEMSGTSCGGIYVSKVLQSAKQSGLHYGDQVLEVNGVNVELGRHDCFIQLLDSSNNLQLVVQCNFKGVNDAMKSGDCCHAITGCNGNELMSRDNGSSKAVAKRVKSASGQPATKLYKALQPFFKLATSSRSESHDDQDTCLNNTVGIQQKLRSASSDPDLSVDDNSNVGSRILKVYRSDQSDVSIPVTRDVTVREFINCAFEKFKIDPASNSGYMLYEMSDDNGICRTRLVDNMSETVFHYSTNSRLYLLNNETIGRSTLAATDNGSVLHRLQSFEVGSQLTNNDFQLFRCIEPTEFIDDLFDTSQRKCYGAPNLLKFAEIVNTQLFWVVTEICSEMNLLRRVKMIQQFIKIAKRCLELNNFNSLFAILGGLSHFCVQRLRNTWDRVSSKYLKELDNMDQLRDPSRNMSNYRNQLNCRLQFAPAIPFYPVVKKDLTFIRDGNELKVDGLVNFEMLRMMAKEIRRLCNMASVYYHKQSLSKEAATNALEISPYSSVSTSSSVFATLRKKKSPTSVQPNIRRVFEEAQMVHEVKQYLASLAVQTDENQLYQMSEMCEASHSDSSSAFKKPEPLQLSASVTTVPVGVQQPSTTRFGVESKQAVQKLMQLTDKVRPHEVKKHQLPFTAKQRSSPHRTQHTRQPHTATLSPESSSVTAKSTVWYNADGRDVTRSPRAQQKAKSLPFASRNSNETRHSYTEHPTDGVWWPVRTRSSAPVSPCCTLNERMELLPQHSRGHSLDLPSDMSNSSVAEPRHSRWKQNQLPDVE